MPSAKPYLLRGMVQWMEDNGLTPQMLVDATLDGVSVPPEHVKAGKIVLNIAERATVKRELDNDYVSFGARFGGVAREVWVPMLAVLAVYARENGQGMTFPVEDGPAPPSAPEPPRERPKLRVVK
ncbi:MAG: ClpXP protease specificity-enhancing factor [Immundisolibacter sp.]|uniref:ClpXP protease specificity-enhancing factor n=1 Tax=Immundisolibacter sp. TaxID=1934948 RepID=UPI003D106683